MTHALNGRLKKTLQHVTGIPTANLFSQSTKSPRHVTRPRGAKMKKAAGSLDLQLLSADNVDTRSTKSFSHSENAAAKGHKNVRVYPEVVRFAAHRIRMQRRHLFFPSLDTLKNIRLCVTGANSA